VTAPALAEFRAQVRAWLEAELSGEFADVRGVGGPGREHEGIERRRAWERRLGEGGWIGLGWPVEAGGRGLPLEHQVVFHEEYARADGPGRVLHMSEQLLAPTLLAFGTPEQQTEHLPGILRGETLWCQGYSEPGAGSDLAGVSTRAVREGEDYVLTGQKVWTSLAHVADWCFVLARTEAGSSRHAGLSFLLVPMNQPGIEVRPIVQITGTSEFNEVFFDGARTPVANRVGAEGDGWQVAMALLGFERGVSTLGQQMAFRNELDAVIAAARANGAVQDPLIRQRLVQAEIGLRLMRFGALRLLDQEAGGAGTGTAVTYKIQWATWRRSLGELAMDVLGQAGEVAAALPDGDYAMPMLTDLFLNARADTIYGGTNQIQRNLIAERGLGLPREPRGNLKG